ncbi:benzoate-CoA ligase family protein [Sneathiella glossodoripedis]|uniref:benzoate-CoA ligase family protein n=1 Tax=Sneathiella glossodoripedis TaxID=418853 RepID=UPI00047158B9|nr:benzoate-CoA ligase family protein [Sneathiella glossodoripedis]
MALSGNAATYFVDRHIDEGRAGKVAFREADGERRELTYARLAEQSSQFAGALQRAGLRREERAAMILLDQIEYPVAFWGALKQGVVPVPINTLLSTDVYKTILSDSRASILFVSKALWPVVEPALAGNDFIKTVVMVGGKEDGAVTFEEFMDGAPVNPAVQVSEDEMAFWLYSSGSTGQPKGVKHIHSSLKATADTFGQQVLGIREEDVVFSVAKIFFAYGLGNAMSFPLSVGATTILYSGRPTPDVVFDVFEAEDPTVFCGVPTLYAALVAAQDANPERGQSKSLRICLSAGEALPKEIGEAWYRTRKVEIIDGVGSTEMLHIFLSNRPGDVVYGTSGVAVPGYEVRLVDENDQEVTVGEIGELLVKGPSAAEGYWNRRQKSLDTFQGHWTRTGDKYERTDSGRYIYCGRTDDMFKVSGIWVSPFEVEQALIEHSAVLEAAVVPWADEDGLEKPKAYIVLKETVVSVDEHELKQHVQDKIGKWKYPRWIETVRELPKTATGKIQRFKLRQGA